MDRIKLNNIKIKPISTEQDFNEANEIINSLVDADLIKDKSLRNKALNILEAVTILAIEYEKKHYPIPKPKPLEAIKERMSQLNLTQKEVAKYFGGENRVSEVLNGKRNLTLRMIREIHKNLGISSDTLIKD